MTEATATTQDREVVRWTMQTEPVWDETLDVLTDPFAAAAAECVLVQTQERALLAELGCPDTETIVVRKIEAYDRDDAWLEGTASPAAAEWLRDNAPEFDDE